MELVKRILWELRYLFLLHLFVFYLMAGVEILDVKRLVCGCDHEENCEACLGLIKIRDLKMCCLKEQLYPGAGDSYLFWMENEPDQKFRAMSEDKEMAKQEFLKWLCDKEENGILKLKIHTTKMVEDDGDFFAYMFKVYIQPLKNQPDQLFLTYATKDEDEGVARRNLLTFIGDYMKKAQEKEQQNKN